MLILELLRNMLNKCYPNVNFTVPVLQTAWGYIAMPKGNLAKNEYDVSFTNGMLEKSKISQPSEILAAAMILPNALKQIFAIPTELIQFKVDYSSSEKELLELKKAMLEAQIEIDKKQLELESQASDDVSE